MSAGLKKDFYQEEFWGPEKICNFTQNFAAGQNFFFFFFFFFFCQTKGT